MLSSIIYSLTGKQLVFYNAHRQTAPLVERNSRKYVFINPMWLFRSTAILGRRSRVRYRVIAAILTFFSPAYIIEINWIDRLQTLYLLWCKRNACKLIVLQHGAYVGGIITDIAHRHAKCNILLCWSTYFLEEFARFNLGKGIKIIVRGNSVYNSYDRDTFVYRRTNYQTILIATSVVKDDRKRRLEEFIKRLCHLGFSVTVKEHVYQRKLSTAIDGAEGTDRDIYSLLASRCFDIVVSDISTSLLDSIFFKNYTLFFSPCGDLEAYTENIYSKFMTNIAMKSVEIASKRDVVNRIDVDSQEQLFNFLVSRGDNYLAGFDF